MNPSLRVLSLMSGTSADGIDAVLVHFSLAADRLTWQVNHRLSVDYEPALRQRILACLKPSSSDVILLTQVHAEVGQAYAKVAEQVQAQHQVDVVAVSGQTVYHIPRLDPDMGWHTPSTLQLGEAAIVAERTQRPVVSDFRQSDMAAGGQGAPMVSFGDHLLYSKPGKARAIHNLGGISNLTYLPANGNPDEVIAFDTGPANCLIDEAVKRHFKLEFDMEGLLAAQGQVNEAVLAQLMAHPYLKLPLPKTTGREIFTLDVLEQQIALNSLEAHDLIATLSAFSIESIAQAYEQAILPRTLNEVIVAGGGVKNHTLMDGLVRRLNTTVLRFEDLGWQATDREALAFGVMAYYRMLEKPNTLPNATGARHATIAGKLIVPSRL